MIYFKMELTIEEKQFCEYWLKYYSLMARYITSEYFGLHNLHKMIAYEVNTRQRHKVVNLLLGRYSKLEKQLQLKRAEFYMEDEGDASFREDYRKVLETGSNQARWPSN